MCAAFCVLLLRAGCCVLHHHRLQTRTRHATPCMPRLPREEAVGRLWRGFSGDRAAAFTVWQ